MNKKTERIEVLKQLIMTNKAASQEDLCAMLKAKGIITTQATLSRDLKDLKVSKSPDSVGGYKYSLPTYVDESAAFDHLSVSPVGIRSIEFSGQLAVIKTKPGYANMVGSIIDDN
jgi:transcriptional regulator of arginine metabolism